MFLGFEFLAFRVLRFFCDVNRVKPQAYLEIPDIEEELGLKLAPLSWLPNFFSLPPEAQIASTLAYQQGKLYGMDAASGAAVAALEISSGDHVLDLCAAPGNALTLKPKP